MTRTNHLGWRQPLEHRFGNTPGAITQDKEGRRLGKRNATREHSPSEVPGDPTQTRWQPVAGVDQPRIQE